MTRDEIMHLVNETAPRYESWGCEAHFQNFAHQLIQIEREACADFLEHGVFDDDGHHKQHNTLKSSVQKEVSDED